MRITFIIALILLVLYLPWWVGALVALAACFIIDRFYEVFIYGIAVDALYGSALGFHGYMYLGSLFSLCIFTCSLLLRDKLSW